MADTRDGWRFSADDGLRRAVAALLPGDRAPATPSIPDLPLLWPARGLEPTPSDGLRPFLLAGTPVRTPPLPNRLGQQHVAALQVSAGLVHRLRPMAEAPWLQLGHDARFWAMLAGDALALVASGQFVPRLVSVAGGATFRWLPLVEYGAALARLNELAYAMPDAARAGHPDAAPGYAVKEVLGRLVDGLVRSGGMRRDPPVSGAAWHTLQALTKLGPELVLPAAVVEHLGAAGTESALPARVTFRVVPVSEAPWRVEFLLQDRRDPSVLIPAATVWRRDPTVLEHFRAQGYDPEELLLRGLAKASTVSSIIHRALEDPAPTEVACSVEEAYDFLKTQATHLELLGFGMQLPAWWRRKGSRFRLGVRGRARSAAGHTASGELGTGKVVRFDWQAAVGDSVLSRAELERLAALKRPLVEVRGQWVELDRDALDQAMALMDQPRDLSLVEVLMQGSPSDALPLLGLEGEGDLAPVLEHLQNHAAIDPVSPPEAFRGQLRGYQQRGLEWLAFLTRFGLGACLADDMGLGKTVQTIALILHRRAQGRCRPTLLLCPTSVVSNWLRELARFAPTLRCQAIASGAEAAGAAKLAREVDVLVTSYGVASRQSKELAAVDWDGVVLDEATNVKNAETARAQAARKLKAEYRLALTGTPVENRLSELHAILAFANPGFLGSERAFRQHFALPIEKWNDQARAEELQRIVQPFILRRTKRDPEVAADLPAKREAEVVCVLTPEQASLYQATVDDMLAKIDAAEGIERRGLVLTTIARLKQICNHPANFLGDGSTLGGRSGKLLRLEEMLAEVAELGERALIFTQFAGFGARLATHLQETVGLPVPFYHGALSGRARDQIVDTFQQLDGPGALLISIRAGGVGLNLTAENHVFHYDRWWNPAVEDQATDRAFRFGQTRDVMVYKFMTQGTIEVHVADMIAAKRQLAGLVVRAGESWLTELSTGDLRDIFALDQRWAEAA